MGIPAQLHFVKSTVDGDRPWFSGTVQPGKLSNVVYERHTLDLIDMRTLDELDVDTTAFEIKTSAIGTDAIRKMIADDQLEDLYAEYTELTKSMTGAQHAFCWHHRVRKGGVASMTDECTATYTARPALSVHCDYPESYAVDKSRKLLTERGLSPDSASRVQMFNVWRPLVEQADSLLAILDARTFDPKDKLLVEIRNGDPNAVPEVAVAYNSAQRWCALRDHQPHELLVFKQYDSAPDVARTTAHGAYTVQGATNVRESIEVRLVVMYD